MLRYVSLVFCALVLFAPIENVFAHGEDKPGPHGGFIKMPGVMHTEVVPIDSRSFRVYLLDINFENPTVNNSSLRGQIKRKNGSSPVKCDPKENYFHCVTVSGWSLDQGELVFDVVRDGMQGIETRYELPLKTAKP